MRRRLGFLLSLPVIYFTLGVSGCNNEPISGTAGSIPSPNPSPPIKWVDSSGNIYIADSGNNVVRKVDAGTGDISTVAGNGSWAYTGDGGPATAAAIADPDAIAIDSAGNLYIGGGDAGDHVRKVDASTGLISTIAGNPSSGGCSNSGCNGRPAVEANFGDILGLTLDKSENLYIVSNTYIWKMNLQTGLINIVAGNGTSGYSGDGGPATSAELASTGSFNNADIAFDSLGNLYFADLGNNVIRKIDTTGIISTVAGDGTSGYSGDGRPATSAKLNSPNSVAVDSQGDIFIADFGNNVVRMVSATTGDISTAIGNRTASYSGDGGAATSAELHNPDSLAFDAAGNLYIGDDGNNVIRMVSATTRDISTVVGNGTGGYSGDGGSATSAEIKNPFQDED